VTVQVRRLELPGDSVLGGQGVFVPELRVADATIDVSFDALPEGKAADPEKGDKLWKGLADGVKRVVDTLEGNLSFTLLLQVMLPGPLGTPDIQIPVSLDIAGGKINAAKLAGSIAGHIKAWDEDSKNRTANAFGNQPQFVLDGDELVFQMHILDIPVDEYG